MVVQVLAPPTPGEHLRQLPQSLSVLQQLASEEATHLLVVLLHSWHVPHCPLVVQHPSRLIQVWAGVQETQGLDPQSALVSQHPGTL